MAYASITYTSASGTTFALTNSSGDPIEYLRQNDISVTVNGVLKTLTTDYTFNTAGTAIVLNTAVSGATVVITRTTDIADATVSFTAGSTLTAQDLNNSDKQNRFALQEFSDTYGALTTGTGDLSALAGFIGSAETWVSDNAHAPTTGAVDNRIDSKIDTALTTDVVAGDSITITDNSPSSGQITIGVANNGISTAKIADSAVTTVKIADSNVTTAKIADSNVTTAKIADGGVTTVKVADNAITSAKIADGTIIAGDIASDAVTTAKILDANITTAKLASDSVTTAKVADGAITNAKLASGIDGAKLTAGSVPNTALADTDLQTLAGCQTGAAAAFAALTAAEVATLDGITSTTAELNILDGVTADANEINRLDGITTSTSELNQLTGKTISGTLTPGNTNDIPTSSAVNNWVSGVVNALGGFVAIPNEVSFPNTNPDPSDDAGTVVSVSDAGGMVINGSGTSTSGQTLAGSTVTITGFPSSLYSTTLPAGMGLQVQTTTTLNTYTYHKIIAREEDIIQLSDDINDFFARYRVGATNPTIDLDAGDLFFNTTTGKMLVYDGTTSSWEEVQSIGNFYINTLSSSAGTGGGSASFNGTAYRFALSNPPLFAQQLLVSINGVVQKPNSGTSQPAEGFAIDGNDIIFSQAPATSSPFFIVTLGSTVNIGTPSDDTVSTAKIQNGAVTTAKLGSNLTVDLASGSAAAPSLTFDANTGVYSPGEDQVAISTGGTGRLFVTSSGSVGIGTSSPSSLLHLSVATAASDGTKGVRITNPAGTAAMFECGSSNDSYIGTTSGSDFSIRTNNTSRIYVTNGGNVGIGSTAPSEKLTLSDGNIRLDSTTSTSKIILFHDTAGLRHVIGSDATAGTNEFGLRTEGQIVFGAGSGRGEAARIDASKRLLMGTSSARSNIREGTDNETPKIQFESATNDYSEAGLSIINNSSSGFAPQLWLGRSASDSIGGNALVSSGRIGSISFNAADGTNFIQGARIQADIDGTSGSGDLPTRLSFSTTADGASSPTERVRIDSNGALGVVCASNTDSLYVSNAAGAGTTRFLIRGRHGATGVYGGTESFVVYTNGNVQNTNNSYGAYSDIKLKENIVDANSQWDDLKALQVRNYNLKEGQTHTQIGLIAQEVELVSPGLVYESPDRDEDGNDLGTVTKSVNYSVLYMKAVKALQEAMERIETLEAKVAALESA